MFQEGDRVVYSDPYIAKMFGNDKGTVIKSEINDRGIEVTLVEWDKKPWNPQINAGPLKKI